MTSLLRRRFNNVGTPKGTTNPITLSTATTVTVSWVSAPANLPVITSASGVVVPIVVEPGALHEERIWVYTHATAATTAKAYRGRETSTAVAHSSKPWVHAPTVYDINAGGTPLTPLFLGSVTLAAPFVLPAYTYAGGTGTGTLVGATITANANGTLTVDGTTVSAGMTVAVVDITGTNFHAAGGVYECTTAGSATSKWVLTRAAPFNTVQTFDTSFVLYIVKGAVFNGGTVSFIASSTTPAYVWRKPSFSGNDALTTTGIGTVARGYGSLAVGISSVANTAKCVAWGDQCYAMSLYSMAGGVFAEAYATKQVALAGGYATVGGVARAGSAQTSTLSRTLPVKSTESTNSVNLVTFLSASINVIAPKLGSLAATYRKSVYVTIHAVARAVASPYHSVGWSVKGLLVGNGSSGYAWVPSAPTVSKDFASTTTSAWSFTLSTSGYALIGTLTITGGGVAVNAEVTIVCHEVAS